MKTRAQSSLEYLMTYGWAILVISAIGLVIWQMGVFKVSCPEKIAQGFSEIEVLDYKVTTSGVTLVLVNNGGSRVDINSEGAVSATVNSVSCTSTNPGITTFRPGAKETVGLTCTLTEYNPGDCYVGNISITYNTTSSGLSHTSSGTIRGGIE
ncbi:MAG: hypothetical protein MSIBF_04890 [Candidatus Altiarchaeales archaeon IMC4]|nr:MAG: hypothetical protein MSIBF_04890 [Candidatus Altiarchaeales archaeon IMC4]